MNLRIPFKVLASSFLFLTAGAIDEARKKGKNSKPAESTLDCSRAVPLPVWDAISGSYAEYGTFIDGDGIEKPISYGSVLEEYWQYSFEEDERAYDNIYFLYPAEKNASDIVYDVPEDKYIFFRFGRSRQWDLTFTPTPPSALLPPREFLEALLLQDPFFRFFRLHFGPSYYEFLLDQYYSEDGLSDQASELDGIVVNQVLGDELFFYLDKFAVLSIDGCLIPDAISYLSKTERFVPRTPDPEDPVDFRTATGWFVLLPPLEPGLHTIEGMTYNGNFIPPGSIYEPGFNRTDERFVKFCVGDASNCDEADVGVPSGGKKGGRDRKKRALKDETDKGSRKLLDFSPFFVLEGRDLD
jgi:hypothetical protein